MRNDPTTAPLAVDGDGTPISLPEGAAGWRVRRQTGGRPRLMLGADRQPLRLPVDISLAELEDVLAPAIYRLDLVDQAGNSLGVAVPPLQVGVVANDECDGAAAPQDDGGSATAVPTALPATSSEVRLVLEANVRAMQASFQHNQRTLELSLRMADTLRDGVRVLADAQADWIKALASSKGYLRNASRMPQVVEVPVPAALPSADDSEADDEDEEIVYEEPRRWTDMLGETLVPLATPMVAHLVQSLTAKPMVSSSGGAPRNGASGGAMDKVRDLFDWRRAAEKGAAARAKDAAPAASTGSGTSLLSSLPPDLVAKLMTVRTQLTPAEQQRLMELIGALAPADIPGIVSELQRIPAEQLADTLRRLIRDPSTAAS